MMPGSGLVEKMYVLGACHASRDVWASKEGFKAELSRSLTFRDSTSIPH